MSGYKIWCNADLPPEAKSKLESGLSQHQLIFSSQKTGNLGSAGECSDLVGADIAFGQPDPGQITTLESLKWVHITSAGYTRYDNDSVKAGFRQRGAIFTNSSSVYDDPCAEHVVAFILAQARQLLASIEAQTSTQSWVYGQLRPITHLLKDQTILIVGYGAIGKRLTELLKPFGPTLIGVRRMVKGDEPVPMHTIDELDDLLPRADHVVNILPANDQTDNYFDGARFAKMKPGVVFHNIGRGNTVNQEDLMTSLESGHIAAAYLDVTTPEPLPADHPLWKTKNCVITPHIAGGFAGEAIRLVEHFLENLGRFSSNSTLVDRLF